MKELLTSIGEFKSIYTLVDFYQYIKGVEYLICVAFFIAFPLYYKYIHSSEPSGEKDEKE